MEWKKHNFFLFNINIFFIMECYENYESLSSLDSSSTCILLICGASSSSSFSCSSSSWSIIGAAFKQLSPLQAHVELQKRPTFLQPHPAPHPFLHLQKIIFSSSSGAGWLGFFIGFSTPSILTQPQSSGLIFLFPSHIWVCKYTLFRCSFKAPTVGTSEDNLTALFFVVAFINDSYLIFSRYVVKSHRFFTFLTWVSFATPYNTIVQY